MTRKREMPQRLGLGLALLVALAGAVSAQSTGRFDGNYIGELTLTGIINGDCTKPPLGSAYPLGISGGVVRFKYLPRFDTILIGQVDQNGSFKASARTKSGMINMVGHVEGGNVTATIQSPSCMYSFQSR
jgi:hypothetical protein